MWTFSYVAAERAPLRFFCSGGRSTFKAWKGTTVGDDTKTEANIDREVTQGGPANPTLFNTFVDTLADELKKHVWNQESELPAHLCNSTCEKYACSATRRYYLPVMGAEMRNSVGIVEGKR